MPATLSDLWPDDLGNEHPVAVPPCRIVCLVPSITELLFDLGLGDSLVGRTAFCVRPASRVRLVRTVGGTKDVDMERIRELRPTHVLVNVDENPKWVADALAEFVPHVIVTHPRDPEGNIGLYRLLGGIFGRQEQCDILEAQYRGACAAALRETDALPRQRVPLFDLAKPLDDGVSGHLRLPHFVHYRMGHGAGKVCEALSSSV